MTEETLKCPFCEDQLEDQKSITTDEHSIAVFKCIKCSEYFDQDYYFKLLKLKQKSYSEGYEKGNKETCNDHRICLQAVKQYDELLASLISKRKELEK